MDKSVLLLVLATLFLGQVFTQTDDTRCPYCVDKECGPDGIGGSCGTCPVGQSCHRGTCICDRGCDGLECGPDACGTLCGECLPGQTCQNGLCVGDCEPQCVRADGSLRTCGWDRCGRNDRCGTCPDSETCNFRCRDGTCECVPNCEDKHCGDDGCGGSCGTCEPPAICQGPTDPFPNQCYIDCFINMFVEVRELQTEQLVVGVCEVDITGPLGFVALDEVYPGSAASPFEVDISDGKYGDYNFVTTCPGYQVSTEIRSVTLTGQTVTLYVDWNTILIEVRDESTLVLLPQADISVTASGYSATIAWFSPSFLWSHNGFKSYTFTTSSEGYTTRTVSEQVTVDTTLITLFLSVGGIDLRVEECETGDAVSTATIEVAGTTINYNGGASFVPPNGFTSYTFQTSSGNYLSNTQTVSVTSTTSLITLCVFIPPIPVEVTDCTTGELIDGASISVSSSVYVEYSLTFTHFSSGATWTPVGYQGAYTFEVSADEYDSDSFTQAVNSQTSSLSFCLIPSAKCGDGVCNAAETASPTNANRCHDCGRLRGVISLAVGQKDQLVNITVSVWAHPTNPALFLRDGEPVPDADFTVLSDSKGFFGISTLSFDASPGRTDPGQSSRRFYFSLSGNYTDRTGDDDVVITLLPLWWNYELTNTQWLGSGDLTNTNNSPSLYFYMTPPFPQEDALVRVILSWGTLISNPSNSLPDMDLVVAGPVDNAAIATYGTGIINFQNKDAHAEADELPFAKLITDSAQGFGPEVFDFYGRDFTNIGFSESYAPGAEANAYEIWVDRPNSSPNTDSAFTFLYDTNSFIVVYVNNGLVNEQVLFDELTDVDHAYGFYNNDQWNDVPVDATMWHIIDIIEGPTTIKFEGFPGEDVDDDEDDSDDKSEEAGAKYAYNAGFFESTKSVPCGHTSARGANPAYCPATLTYPQNNKK